MDHGGTLRHGYDLPAGSYERIVASPPKDATGLVIPLGVAALQQSSIQRYKPRNAVVIPDVNGATNNFGDDHATHTPGNAGRALPRRDRRSAPITFDTYQNIDGAKVAAGSARGVAERGDRPRETTARGQRPHPLNEATRILRAARLRDLLASIAEWERASGPDRTYWRRDARHRLAEWRRLHAIPERAAFQQAVARARA